MFKFCLFDLISNNSAQRPYKIVTGLHAAYNNMEKKPASFQFIIKIFHLSFKCLKLHLAIINSQYIFPLSGDIQCLFIDSTIQQ